MVPIYRKKNKKIKKELSALSQLHTTSGATEFQIDLSDDRFSALVQGDSRYGIDPTSTLFKKTTGMKKILEVQRDKSVKIDEETYQEKTSYSSDPTTSTTTNAFKSKKGNKEYNNNEKNDQYPEQDNNNNSSGLKKINTKLLADKLKRKFSQSQV